MDFNLLTRFSAGSCNDGINKHLWLKGASLIFDQLDNLVKNVDQNYSFNIINVSSFSNKNSSNFGEILKKNRSDKSTAHNYHHLYSYILNEITTEKLNILEIGLGTNNPTLVSTMGGNGRPGASLYAFKQYLPNANIYGADIDKNILFNEERINTCYVDQLDIKTFDNIKKTFGNIEYDLIIDDGLHSIGANFNTLLFALNNIKINGWIVIEDIHIPDNWFSIVYILSKNKNIKTYFIKAEGGYLFCVKRLF
tara:strand:+ start:478 stop:1233 length:756 start_codon:yes stop_codon:yes gene_type:complete